MLADVSAEIGASNALYRRATEARNAADRALVGEVDRVLETLYRAATRLGRQCSPGGDGRRLPAGTESAAAAPPTAAGDRTDARLGAAVDAARAGLEALRAHLVEAATSVRDVAGGDEEKSLSATMMPATRRRRPPSRSLPTISPSGCPR